MNNEREIEQLQQQTIRLKAEAARTAEIKADQQTPAPGHTGALRGPMLITGAGSPGMFCDDIGFCSVCHDLATEIARSGVSAAVNDPIGNPSTVVDTSTGARSLADLRSEAAAAIYDQIRALAFIRPGDKCPAELGGIWDVEDAIDAGKAMQRLIPAVSYLDPLGRPFTPSRWMPVPLVEDTDDGMTEFGNGSDDDDDGQPPF